MKINKQRLTYSIILLPFLTLILSGCGKSISQIAGEKLAEKAIESQSGEDAKVDIKDGNVKIETKEGGILAGDDVKLPSDFPTDVYVVEGKIKAAISSEGNYSITIESDKTIEELSNLYQEKLKAADWKITGTMNFGDSASVVGEKDTRNISIMFAKNDGKTSVILSLGKK